MVSEKPWTAVDVLRLLLAWLLLLCAGQLILTQLVPGGGLSQTSSSRLLTLAVQACSFHVAALILVGILLSRRGITWAEAFGLSLPHASTPLFAGALAGLLVLPSAWALGQASALALPELGFDVKPQQAVQMVQGATSDAERALTAVMAIVLAPVVEEVIFRGILYPAVKQVGYPRLAGWGTAFLFAAIHATPAIFLPLFLLSALLAHLYERTGTLLAPIATHIVFNLANFLWLMNPRLMQRWLGADA